MNKNLYMIVLFIIIHDTVDRSLKPEHLSSPCHRGFHVYLQFMDSDDDLIQGRRPTGKKPSGPRRAKRTNLQVQLLLNICLSP